MKKLIGFLFTAIALVLGYPEASEMTVSFLAVVIAVAAITELWKQAEIGYTQLFSWGVGIVFSFAAWYAELGIFAAMQWYFALVTGFLVALATNGIADTGMITAIWEYLRGLFVKK